MAYFSYLRKTVTPNTETECGIFTNSQVFLTLRGLTLISPTGCPYFILRIYKNNILYYTYSPQTVYKNSNIIKENINIPFEKGTTIKITINNLDPLGQNHDFEGGVYT